MWIRVTMMVMTMMMMMMMMMRLQKTGAYSSLLSIGRADPRLNGNYTCTASNAAATAEFTADLHVHGKYLSLPLNRMTMKWIEKKNRFLLLIYIVNYNGIFRKKNNCTYHRVCGWLVTFYRSTRMHSADYAVGRCLSVRLSHASILSTPLNISYIFYR